MLGIVFRPTHVPVNQHLAQTRLYHRAHESAVITAHRLDTLGVHLIVRLWTRPVQTSIALLVDQQVGKVDLFELESNRLDKRLAHVLGRLRTKCHGLLDVTHAKLDHHRVCITVDNDCIMGVAVLDRVPRLDLALGLLNHLTAIRCDTHGNLQAWQTADRRACKTVHGICTHLQRKLTTIQHRTPQRVCLLLKIGLGRLARCQQMLQYIGQQSLSTRGRDEIVLVRRHDIVLPFDQCQPLNGALVDQRRIAQIVRHHNGRIQRRKIQRGNGLVIVALLRI